MHILQNCKNITKILNLYYILIINIDIYKNKYKIYEEFNNINRSDYESYQSVLQKEQN